MKRLVRNGLLAVCVFALLPAATGCILVNVEKAGGGRGEKGRPCPCRAEEAEAPAEARAHAD